MNRQRALALIAASCFAFTFNSCRIVSFGGRALYGREDVPVSVARARVRAAYNLRRGTFRITRVGNKIQLQDMATLARIGERTFASTDRACRNRVTQRGALRVVVESAFASGPAWETQFEIRARPGGNNAVLDHALRDAYGVSVTCRLLGDTPAEKARFALVGQVEAEKESFACRLDTLSKGTPLQSTGGEAPSELNTSVFDPARDCALHLTAERVVIEAARPRATGKTFPIRMEFPSTAAADFVEGLYRAR